MRKTMEIMVVGVGIGLFLVGASGKAHHAFAAEFDASKTVR